MSRKLIVLSLLGILPFTFVSAKTVKDIIKDIEKKQGTIPIYKLKETQKRDRINIAVEPSSRFSTVFPAGTAERDFEVKLNKEIEQLHYLSKKLKGADTKQRIWMRLAKAYSEKAALIERREQESYDKKLKMYFAGSINKKPSLNLAKAQVYNKKAVGLYKYYIKEYPKANDLDQALFFLGYNNVGLGKSKEAIKYYKILSSRFPKSDYIDEANLSLGDHYFDKDRRGSAKKHYSMVASDTRTPLGALALYKLSWVERKMGNHQEALKGLLKVIRLSKNAGARNKRNIALASEAKKDLPMFYAEAGDPKNALTYFTNIMSRDEASKSIEKLAYYYVDKGDKEEAQYLFSKLIKINPQNDKSFDYQYSLVNMQSSTGRTDLYEKELYKWVREFGPNSKWAKTSKNKVKVKDSLKKAEISLRSHVLKLHNSSRVSKNKTKMLRAEKGYQIYLDSFKKSSYNPEMQFYYGELLYEMSAYKDAYKAYQKVKPSKYTAKANLNSVLSLEKAIPSDEEVRAKVGKSTKEYPLSKNEEVFIKAGEAYLADIKNREQRVDIKYRIASIYYSHNYFNKSEKVFKEIIKEYPGSKYSAYASDLIIDSYKLKKDYDGLAKAGAELIAIGNKTGGVKTSKVKTVLEQSAFKKIEGLTATEKPAAVAEAFLGFTKSYPKSSFQNQAFYNSGIYYEKAGMLKKALSSYGMVSSSSNAELYSNAQKFSAFLNEKLGFLIKAAQSYEKLASSKNVSMKERVTYLTNASVIREAFNDPIGLKRIFGTLKKYDKAKNIYKYEFRMAEIYQKTGRYDSAKNHYLKFFNTAKGEPFLLVKSARIIGDYYQKAKKYDKARYWFKASTLTYNKYKRREAKAAAADAAYSAFRLSDKLFYTYLGIKIPSDPKKQKRIVDDKLALVNKIEKEMTKVINFDDGYTIVSALNRMGQAHQHLAFSLLSTPLPKGLTSEEIGQYQKLLQQTVAPFKKNAITSYKKALEKGEALNAYNNDYLSTLFELSKIDSNYVNYRVPFIAAGKLMQYDGSLVKKYPDFQESMGKSEKMLLDDMSDLLSKDSQNTKALYTLANYYHVKGFSGVSDLFIDKTSKTFQATPEYSVMKGLNRMLENKRRSAVKEFKAALKKEPNHLLASVNLSSLYAQFGGYESVYNLLKGKVLQTAIPSNMKHFVLNNYALGLLSKNRIDEAAAELKAALVSKTNYVGAIGNLAIVAKVIQKNKNEGELYFGQYKKLANTQVDLDRIRLMENL
ncbi:MAG: tetratricopeptide repeat protein [Bdellovibrionales bacterium]